MMPPMDRRITASFGVDINVAGIRFDTANGMAGEALHRAKRGGRHPMELTGR